MKARSTIRRTLDIFKEKLKEIEVQMTASAPLIGAMEYLEELDKERTILEIKINILEWVLK